MTLLLPQRLSRQIPGRHALSPADSDATRPSGRPVMIDPVSHGRVRVTVEGRFFRAGGRKFHPRGVTYGPFAPNAAGEPFGTPESTRADFEQMVRLGANLLRVYHVPPRWLLDLAEAHGLKVLVDVPWNKHLCFLDEPASRRAARQTVVEAARACATHPAVFALSVVNEVPADIVRWSGAVAVADFIDELVEAVREVDPDLLCTFGNFPPTEFLRPRLPDFLCFNVYLHERRPFENYLARLQMLADSRPLLLGEIGIDSRGEGLERQAEILEWQVESAFRGGCAGVVVYSFTDEWHRNGRPVLDWEFGLTTRDRREKPAFEAVRRQFARAPRFPLAASPRVSVVVASYNGAATLTACLESLERLNYPDYEVLLVDDGSTDTTPQIAARFPRVKLLRHEVNRGLSAARNTGIYAATGEIIAFTDADCRADEDWLHYLVGDLLSSGFVGMGGHNFLPPDDSAVAAAVMVSPGGPAHVMLTDRIAEHVPGCNMAFYRWALLEIGGFDPQFRLAGDDVDICWRLQQRGYRIGFSPAGFVWHYRRNTIRAYLKQQAGYGDAEALLERRHPENFNRFGNSIWHGRIYSPARIGVQLGRPIIYHGLFGTGFFQSIYNPSPGLTLMIVTSLEFHVLVTLPLLVLGSVVPYVQTLGVAGAVISMLMCLVAGWQAEIPRHRRRFWSHPLVALLFLLQPVVRGWARHRNHLRGQQTPLSARETLDSVSLESRQESLEERRYWGPEGVDRTHFLRHLLARLDERRWPNRPDSGWNRFDVEIYGSRWARLQLTTASEYLENGTQILRCRMVTAWSFLARAAFWSLSGTLLLAIGVLGHWWAWFLLLLLPPVAWQFQIARRHLQRLIVAFLDERAKECGLVLLGAGGGQPGPASPSPSGATGSSASRSPSPVATGVSPGSAG